MPALEILFRWIHVLAGVIWIGHLYFFNFVNIPFQGKLDGATKKAVNPELLPRALFCSAGAQPGPGRPGCCSCSSCTTTSATPSRRKASAPGAG